MFRLSCAPPPRGFGLVIVILVRLRLAQAHWDKQRSKRTRGSRLGTLDNGSLTPSGSAQHIGGAAVACERHGGFEWRERPPGQRQRWGD
eukprot:scaffold116100_cov55-Phaeocystis_antarctica.AAC.1